ncbi:MAG TPA: DUF995 domain-containing protein [Devosia sp.]|jgi:hypothetical protein|uniref:DUF995 domain-containing protein n=1 Tax=Devosia sp. TaxID=1871048 RepID=UPI002DDD81CA|nr:DUF995 domain-containing protein [Devosia sp.]HEV2516784.1 DUF995 domain-containing protein [Devosia sp.]
MIRQLHLLLVSLAVAAFASISAMPVTSLEAAEGDPPADALPLSAPELLQLYGNKTWKWGEGGGYFQTDGRVFRARTVGENGVTTAEGKWKITDQGRLCFEAIWVNATKSSPASTCFLHVAVGEQIYQKKLPKGGWYIFRHAKPEPGDQFSKLIRGDLVSPALQKANQNTDKQ